MAQQSVFIPTDGERLKILLIRDGRPLEVILSVWGRTRSQISRYQAMDTLPKKVIEKACEVLNIPESMFDRRLDADQLLSSLEALRLDVDRLKSRLKSLEAEKEELETEKRGLLSVIRNFN